MLVAAAGLLSKHGQHVLYALVAEIVPGAARVFFDLCAKLVDAAEFAFVADTVEETHAQNVAIQLAVKIENIALDRRLGRVLEGRPHADVGDALAPGAVDERGCRIDTEARDDPVMRLEIRRRKPDRMSAAIAANNNAFDPIRPA